MRSRWGQAGSLPCFYGFIHSKYRRLLLCIKQIIALKNTIILICFEDADNGMPWIKSGLERMARSQNFHPGRKIRSVFIHDDIALDAIEFLREIQDLLRKEAVWCTLVVSWRVSFVSSFSPEDRVIGTNASIPPTSTKVSGGLDYILAVPNCCGQSLLLKAQNWRRKQIRCYYITWTK